MRGAKWRQLLKSPRDHWYYARGYLVRAEETDNEKHRQVLLNMASACIELGLEEGLGGAFNDPGTDCTLERPGRVVGLTAAVIPATIISVARALRTKLNGTFSSISAQLKNLPLRAARLRRRFAAGPLTRD